MKTRTGERTPRWHLAYFALAAFDILTVAGSLTLNHQIMGIYRDSIAVNQEWSDRLRDITRLGELAQKTNAPGNDVFDSHNVPAETTRRDTALNQFERLLDVIVSELVANTRTETRRPLLEALEGTRRAMESMNLKADEIFEYFAQGETVLAGREMASMDRSYAVLTGSISSATFMVQNIQAEHLNHQVALANQIGRLEYLVGALIAIMVLCVMIYGHNVAHAVRSHQRDLRVSRDAAAQAAADLAARNQELSEAKARIDHNALHDHLTGLPNRRYLDDVLRRLSARRDNRGQQIAALHIDLDRFKHINDALGHGVGDAVLIHVAELLRANVRQEDLVARIGGDEFVVLCAGDYGSRHLAELAERILRQTRQPLLLNGQDCRVSASIGVAIQESAASGAGSLLVNASIALHRAKTRGRNRYEFFSEALQVDILHHKRTADDILRGLERNEFEPFYQPQFQTRGFEPVGVEALARWRHPERGLLPPAAFLDVAEEIGAVGAIDHAILRRALADFEAWSQRGSAPPRLSVNVSTKRLRDPELAHSLEELRIPPGRVSFELVESIFLDRIDSVMTSNIEALKARGVDIEIDDFGTGHASIVSLLELAPQRLKIARELVTPITESAAQRRLLGSILEIGQTLGLETIAEGVETMEHAAILDDLGCDILQGYAFARPMPAEDLERFLTEQPWRAALRQAG